MLSSAPSHAGRWLTRGVLRQYLCTVFPTSHVLGGLALAWLVIPQLMESVPVTFLELSSLAGGRVSFSKSGSCVA